MRILVCGGRDFANPKPYDYSLENKPRMDEYRFVQKILNGIVNRVSENYRDNDNWLPTDIVIVSGGAKGADSAAADFAIVNYCQLEEHFADWKKYPRAAGPIRNQKMLDTGIDLVVAFPGGRGTAHMIKIAKAAGVEVIEVPYNE